MDVTPNGVNIRGEDKGIDARHGAAKLAGTGPAPCKAMKTYQTIREVNHPHVNMLLMLNSPFQSGQNRSQLKRVDMFLSQGPTPPQYDAPSPQGR